MSHWSPVRIGRKSVAVLALTVAAAMVVGAGALAAPAAAQSGRFVAKANADAYVNSADIFANYGNAPDDLLRAGHRGTDGTNFRSYLRFPVDGGGPTGAFSGEPVPAGCQVTSATMNLVKETGGPNWHDYHNFWVTPAAPPWNDSTLNWDNQPGPDASDGQTHVVWNVSGGNFVFADVTQAVQALYAGGRHRGLVIRSTTTGSAVDVIRFYERETVPGASSEDPRLNVDWEC